MAAPTENYVDYATGNDYSGATFTDGAYTDATKTLVKNAAFTNSKVGHRIYLTDNGSGNITAGYYTIATVTDANTIILATDAGSDAIDAKCTQHDGSTSLPWNTVQGCLDLCGRDSTNGDRINVKSGTAVVNYTSLNITTYGTPTEAAPLLLCGYTTTAGDGGMGEINCNGAAMWADTNNPYLHHQFLEMHTFGDNSGVSITTTTSSIVFCEVHKGASTPTDKSLVVCGGMSAYNYVHDAGTGGFGINMNTAGRTIGNYVYNCPYGIYNANLAMKNIIVDCGYGIRLTDTSSAIGNTIYHSGDSTGKGISVLTNIWAHAIINNIIVGYSGAGGVGLDSSNCNGVVLLANNAYYDNTTAESLAETFYNAGGKVDLAADPFVNAAGGDFSLKTSVVGAIDGAYPGAWYGPAATVDHADIGAVQMPLGAITIFGGSIIR